MPFNIYNTAKYRLYTILFLKQFLVILNVITFTISEHLNMKKVYSMHMLVILPHFPKYCVVLCFFR